MVASTAVRKEPTLVAAAQPTLSTVEPDVSSSNESVISSLDAYDFVLAASPILSTIDNADKFACYWLPLIEAIKDQNHTVSLNGKKLYDEMVLTRKMGQFMLKKLADDELPSALRKIYTLQLEFWELHASNLLKTDLTTTFPIYVPAHPRLPHGFE